MLTKELNINVVEAAERRILETFNNHKLVSMSFSGGKDSLCMSDMVIKTMRKYGISFNRLVVIFFDEEAIYPDIEETVMEWRSRFMSLGAKFYWFCLPIKHFNCCNRLENDESFICWEPGKEDVWVRPMPKFAIRNHRDFRLGMTYQVFAVKLFADIPQMVGLRVAESIQRRQAIAAMTKSKFIYPIYDWSNNDVWLYLKMNNIQVPVSYIYLYKVGVPLNRLRISQFFSVDTIKSLPKVLEFYPDLYQRVLRREPNADLVMLYWDTDMFRSSGQDSKFDRKEARDYKSELAAEIKRAAKSPDLYPGYEVAKKLYSRMRDNSSQATCMKVLQILIAGDPKNRTYRTVLGDIVKDNIKQEHHA